MKELCLITRNVDDIKPYLPTENKQNLLIENIIKSVIVMKTKGSLLSLKWPVSDTTFIISLIISLGRDGLINCGFSISNTKSNKSIEEVKKLFDKNPRAFPMYKNACTAYELDKGAKLLITFTDNYIIECNVTLSDGSDEKYLQRCKYTSNVIKLVKKPQ